MLTRFMQEQFLGAIFVLVLMGLIAGIIGIQVVTFHLAVIHLFGMSGGVNG